MVWPYWTNGGEETTEKMYRTDHHQKEEDRTGRRWLGGQITVEIGDCKPIKGQSPQERESMNVEGQNFKSWGEVRQIDTTIL
jgi:hypothetical protein